MRIRAGKSKDGAWISFRFMRTGFDYMSYITGIKLIQFGNKPVKYIAYLPQKVKTPMFLLSASWKPKYKLAGFLAGITKSPLDLSKFWRVYERKISATIKSVRLGEQLGSRDHGYTGIGRAAGGDGGVRKVAVSEILDSAST